jgi:hypothetical protein
MSTAYPLQWPDGWPRTKKTKRARSNFKCTFAKSRDGIIHQLKLMSVPDWKLIISGNIALRRDGLPYANQAEPEDVGMAVYWTTRDNQRNVMACDRWDRTRDNLRAIEKTLEAMRGMDRWGSTEVVKRAFDGFKALPPALTGWRAVLGDCKSFDEANRAWKKQAFDNHPDRGGTDAAMYKINTAWHEANQELNPHAS